jgi:transcriptional regulator with XRE-family HTH domain
MTEKSELVQELQDKATRDAFVSSQMSIPLSFQILVLREQRGMTQKQLAEKAGMLQPRIAAMERPSGHEPNLRTLKRLASAFDVALVVRFVPFSELVKWAETFSPDTFVVPSFDDDLGFQERVAASAGVQTPTTLENNPILPSSLERGTNTDANQPIIISNSTTVVLSRNNVTVIGRANSSFGFNQDTFNPDVRTVSFGNTLSTSVQTIGVNRGRESTGARIYVGKPVGTAA